MVKIVHLPAGIFNLPKQHENVGLTNLIIVDWEFLYENSDKIGLKSERVCNFSQLGVFFLCQIYSRKLYLS